jgi:hypothetical protein
MLRNFRIAWVGGRFGGGKTAFAVRLAYEFVNRGWAQHSVGNFPCVLFTSLDRLPEVRDTVIVMDEAGLFLQDRMFNDLTAFLRKRNLYLIMSSVMPVPLRAKSLNVQRIINYNTVGLPLWRYSCVLDYMRVQEKMTIDWWYPSEVFGLYDTSYPAQDDGGIVAWVKGAFGASAAGDAAVSSGSGSNDLDALRWVAHDFDAAAEKLAGAVSMAGGKTRRGRR